MAEAATAFLASLDAGQAAKAQMTFDDETARHDWHYIPRGRLGRSLKEMQADQRNKGL